MKQTMLIVTTILLLALIGCGSAEKAPEPANNVISDQGSMGLWFYVDKDYYNGVEPPGTPGGPFETR